MKKQLFLVLMLGGLLLTACNQPGGGGNGGKDNAEDLGTKDFHTQLQQQYIDDPDWTNIKTYVPFVDADNPTGADREKLLGNVSAPNAIKLEFEEVADAETYYVQIAKDAKFNDAKLVQSNEKSYDFYNSELGQEYYFRAAVSEDALASAKVRKFKVNNDAPRNIYVDGVINFRDIGGWETSLVKGARIKQGLYYRCAQFNADSRTATRPGALNITEKGLQTLKELNIKVDIDMRDVPPQYEGNLSPASTADHEIRLLDAHIASGTESTRFSGFASTYKAIFEAMAEADTNPIALHCTHGADRTGISSFFLLALLGAKEEDCGRDYSFTRFAGARKVWHEDEFDNWVAGTKAYEVDAKYDTAEYADQKFAAQMKAHLLTKGISEDTIETIREKFIPGYTRPAAA